jgi:lipopolysaccharide export system ATP-binding protein
VTYLEATGAVVIETAQQRITGAWARMDVKSNKVTVGGNVVVTQGSTVLRGEQLLVDLNANTSEMTGGGSEAGSCRASKCKSQTAKRCAWASVHPKLIPLYGNDVKRNGSDTTTPLLAQRPHVARQTAGEEALANPVVEPHDVAHGDGLVALDLAKSYSRRPVVAGVSLAVRRGEAVGLLGPNGAGKTTVFYMITGLIPADRGTIALDGDDITHLPMYQRARRGVGYLPQEASIFRGLTVEENIRAVLELSVGDRTKREVKLRGLLDEFHISHLRSAPALALSGGERRRVEIARALAAEPRFMLLDEPFAGIDPIAISDIRQLVRQLTSRGIGVLITDHNVRETLELIDRALIIHEGRVLMEGTPREIVDNPDVRRYYLGESFTLG